jgi:hypothetical protein
MEALPNFGSKAEAAIEALRSGGEVDNNDFIDASRLVCEGVRILYPVMNFNAGV